MLLLIDSFSGIDNQIVKMKYVDQMSLEDIAEFVGYSSSYIRQRHAEIRKTLNFLDEYEHRQADRLKKKTKLIFTIARSTKNSSLYSKITMFTKC